MSTKKTKKVLLLVSARKITDLVQSKVTDMEAFARLIGYTRQNINKWSKKSPDKDKLKLPAEAVEKLKNYFNVTLEDIAFNVPRETKSKQDVNDIKSHPDFISLKEELEETRKSRDNWRQIAADYKTELDSLRRS